MVVRVWMVGLAIASLGAVSVAVVSQKLGVTDIRVGPTAAISVSTSADGKIVYVAHGNGVFKSSDGGETWRKLSVE